jgi:cold-inducible RNA-binding protein
MPNEFETIETSPGPSLADEATQKMMNEVLPALGQPVLQEYAVPSRSILPDFDFQATGRVHDRVTHVAANDSVENNRKLYVGNLPYSVSASSLEEMFGQWGTVVSAQVIFDRDTGRSKGFGFVEMATNEQAQAAIRHLNGTEVDRRLLTVNLARPKEDGRPRTPPQR